MSATLHGFGPLVRLVLRLDRVRLPIWIIGIAALVVVSAASVVGLYETPEEIASYASLNQGNPTLEVVNGPGFGFDDPNVGVIMSNETTIWAAIAAATMSVFLVVRHTRAEEEAERAEALRARTVGRHAPLAAAVTVVGLANLVVGVVSAVGCAAYGLPLAGSVAFGAAVTMTGLVFTGFAALMAQVTAATRPCLGWSMGMVGLAYLVRAMGDLGDNALAWLSPLGWAHRLRPWAGEQWWVAGLGVAAAALLLGAAVRLSSRRDLGGGLLPQRPGPARAAVWVTSPFGLALRLHRASIVAWSGGLFTLGAMYGSVGNDIEEMLAENPDLAEFLAAMGGASAVDAYLSFSLLFTSMLAGAFAVASVLRLAHEEGDSRAEVVLATAVGRGRWMASHLVLAAVGSLTALVASGVGAGAGLAFATGDAGEVLRIGAASLGFAPAVLVLGAVAAALYAWFPERTGLAWAGYALVLVIALFGELFKLPDWLRAASPFDATPALPAERLDPVPVAVLAVIGAVLVAAAVRGLARRDVPSSV